MENVLTITIEPEHFKNAKSYKDTHECPLGLAIRSTLNRTDYTVGGHTVDITGVPYRISSNYIRPALTLDAIRKAQEGKPVRPLVVTLTRIWSKKPQTNGQTLSK